MSTAEQVLATIRSRGYWRINVRPTHFDAKLIPTLRELEDQARSCIVQIRGWDYPHWPRDGVTRISDGIEGAVDWEDHKEVWRVFQSGQFVHYLSLREDWLGENTPYRRLDIEPSTVIGYESSVYTITEIFLFSARLAARFALRPQVEVNIELQKLAGRELHTFDFNRASFSPTRRASVDLFRYSTAVAPENLIADPQSHARPPLRELFELLNWDTTLDSLRDLQDRLLENRL